jgi:hypothetical protein
MSSQLAARLTCLAAAHSPGLTPARGAQEQLRRSGERLRGRGAGEWTDELVGSGQMSWWVR